MLKPNTNQQLSLQPDDVRVTQEQAMAIAGIKLTEDEKVDEKDEGYGGVVQNVIITE